MDRVKKMFPETFGVSAKLAAEQKKADLAALGRAGEEMERWAEANMPFLEERVLKALEQDAFFAQRDPSFNPEDKNQVHQQVALLRSIEIIRQKVERVILEGRNARFELVSYSTPQEGES